jgi:hypothetical protein
MWLSRSAAPVGVALLAAAVLHSSIFWALQGRGVTGGAQASSEAVVNAIGHDRLVRIAVRADTPDYGRTSLGDMGLRSTKPSIFHNDEVASSEALSPGGQAWFANRYFEADQLDRSPHPLSGWYLDEEALLKVGRMHVILKLWVSAEGRIDHVELLQADPQGDGVELALRQLSSTPMEPALSGGRPVAAVTVVELQTENELVH